MKTLTSAALLLAVLLTACATVSDVVPAGTDTFLVGANVRGGFKSDTEVTAMSIARANEFCSGKGQNMNLLNASNSGTQGWTPQNSQILFKCEAK